MKQKKKITMVIPCYNEEKNVELFYNETFKYLSDKNFKLELIYINDGSKDNTIVELNKLLKKHLNSGIIGTLSEILEA